MANSPVPIRYIRPLYEPLGWVTIGREPRFVIRIGTDEPRAWRASQMACLGWLLGEVYPDPAYWVNLFPGARRGKCDPRAAASWFIRECRKRGPWTPPQAGENPPP